MDEIVKQALAKWPSVPHCYGWLALDVRGAFRMRDEAAQRADSPGDIIRHTALLAYAYIHSLCQAVKKDTTQYPLSGIGITPRALVDSCLLRYYIIDWGTAGAVPYWQQANTTFGPMPAY